MIKENLQWNRSNSSLKLDDAIELLELAMRREFLSLPRNANTMEVGELENVNAEEASVLDRTE